MSTQDHSSDVASATNNIEPPFNDESIKKTMKVCRAPRKFRDRIIEDVVSEEILYYCHHKQHFTNSEITFHRGNIDGDVIAIAVKDNLRTSAVIDFPDQTQLVIEPKSGLSANVSNGRSFFEWQGKRYGWSKLSRKVFALKNEQDKIMGRFIRKHWSHEEGSLEVYESEEIPMDVIVVTFVMFWYGVLMGEAVLMIGRAGH